MAGSLKALSLVIPTYNRSQYLDKQIAWAIESVGDMWPVVELVVCDNASDDTTADICAKWAGVIEDDTKFRFFRNDENVGLVRNCLLGIERAAGKFVWLIGDDDPINDSAIRNVLNIIAKFPDLNIVHLNHRCISGLNDEVVVPKFYNLDNDVHATGKGASLLSDILQTHHTGGFMFITANILNKNMAMQFIKDNPPEEDLLLAYPMLLNAGLASIGPFYLVCKCLLDCVYYQSSWSSRYERVHYEEVPKTLMKLHKLGVNKKAISFCLDFQFKDLYSVRDVFYKFRKDISYFGQPDFSSWLRKWKFKKLLKWRILFQ